MKKIVLLVLLLITIMSYAVAEQDANNTDYDNNDSSSFEENITESGPEENITESGPEENVEDTVFEENVTESGPEENVEDTGLEEIISDSNKSKITITTYGRQEKNSMFDAMPIASIVIVIYILYVIKRKEK